MSAIVQYNVSEKTWEVWPGEIDRETAILFGGLVAHPAGKQGKRLAQLEAIKHDNFALYALVMQQIKSTRQIDGTMDRIIKGALLLLAGHIEPPLKLNDPNSYANERARIRSQSDPAKRYAVSHSPITNTDFCECPDWANGRLLWVAKKKPQVIPDADLPRFGAPMVYGDFMCKHLWALFLRNRLEGQKITVEASDEPWCKDSLFAQHVADCRNLTPGELLEKFS